jgi:hypothetical protein
VGDSEDATVGDGWLDVGGIEEANMIVFVS